MKDQTIYSSSMRSRPTIWAGALLLPLVLARPAAATIAPQLDVPDLTRQADAILVATATANQSTWIEHNLYTLVTLAVEETLKGRVRGEVTLLLPGGFDADRAVPVATVWPGQPRIEPGERVLVFLRVLSDVGPSRKGYYSILGFSQGKFTLEDGDDGSPVAVQNLDGLRLVDPAGVHPGSLRRLTVEQLRREIRQTLASVDGEER